jgi:imidazolonepropionase-like amidohydrolase
MRSTILRAAFAALALATPLAAQQGTYAFVNVDVLPMDGEGVVSGLTVLVEDGLITRVGPASEVPIPEGATRIEGEGRYLMPGLAEMHAHVPPSASPPRETLEDILFLYVANGVTTIRGMLGQDYQTTRSRSPTSWRRTRCWGRASTWALLPSTETARRTRTQRFR